MSAFRTSLRRLPGALPTRGLTTSARFTPTAALKPVAFMAQRSFARSAIAALNQSSPVGDGGLTEPPEHGINVDKPIRMDTSVPFFMLSSIARRWMSEEGEMLLRSDCLEDAS